MQSLDDKETRNKQDKLTAPCFYMEKFMLNLLVGHQQQMLSEILQQIHYTLWKHCQDFHT